MCIKKYSVYLTVLSLSIAIFTAQPPCNGLVCLYSCPLSHPTSHPHYHTSYCQKGTCELLIKNKTPNTELWDFHALYKDFFVFKNCLDWNVTYSQRWCKRVWRISRNLLRKFPSTASKRRECISVLSGLISSQLHFDGGGERGRVSVRHT